MEGDAYIVTKETYDLFTTGEQQDASHKWVSIPMEVAMPDTTGRTFIEYHYFISPIKN